MRISDWSSDVCSSDLGRQTFGAVARQNGVAITVLERVDGNRYEITGFDFKLALTVQELFEGNQSLGFKACIDYHKIVIDPNHFCRNDITGLHVMVFYVFGTQVGKDFAASGDRELNGGH